MRAVLSRPVTLTRSDGRPYRTTRERRPARRHLLSAGLAFCGRCGAPLAAQVRRRRSGELFVSYLCDPRLGRVCVGIVGHHLERCVVEALFSGLADPTTRARLTARDPRVTAALTAELDTVEGDLAALARRWGLGELSRLEWEAAREGLVVRAQTLRGRLGVLSIPTFDATALRGRWPTMGLAGRRSVVSSIFERIEVHRATTTLYDPGRVRLVWRNAASEER